MKYLIFSCAVLLFCCKNSAKTNIKLENAESESFDISLLVGSWKRTTSDGVKQTYEKWWLNAIGDVEGIGYIKDGVDTVWMELLSIKEINDTLNYIVKGVNESDTYFKFIKESYNTFECVNPENAFPKKIKYTVENNNINALIEDENESVEFIFEKM